jgi:protocatechuate 3,4-dioxygenase beta subunit
MRKATHESAGGLTRRTALGVLAGAGAAFAVGCGDSSSEAGGAEAGAGGDGGTDAARGTDAGASVDAGECAVTPEGEIGPYFADDSDARFNRSNVLANLDGTDPQTGIELTLTVLVLDTATGCAPYADAQVDIWSCNASGVYSDQSVEGTSSETWLRGYQTTDAGGKVTFVTIIPGWYAGRTTHIHLRVRSSYSAASSTSDGTNTTQAFFDQTLIDRLATSVAPYGAEGKNPTTNATDHVYAGETDGANELSVTGDDTSGYAASLTIRLPITSTGGTTTTGPMGGMGPGGDGGPPGSPPDGGGP